jgi:hypothetical protein
MVERAGELVTRGDLQDYCGAKIFSLISIRASTSL